MWKVLNSETPLQRQLWCTVKTGTVVKLDKVISIPVIIFEKFFYKKVSNSYIKNINVSFKNIFFKNKKGDRVHLVREMSTVVGF